MDVGCAKRWLRAAAFVALLAALASQAWAGGTLVVGMTAATYP